MRIGLVNHIYEAAELLPAAEAMAKKIVANGPLAVKFTMEAIERGVEMPLQEGLFLEATLFGVACATEDMREGTKAFFWKKDLRRSRVSDAKLIDDGKTTARQDSRRAHRGWSAICNCREPLQTALSPSVCSALPSTHWIALVFDLQM